MVRAIEQSALRKGLRRDHPTLSRSGTNEIVFERVLALSYQHNVPGRPSRLEDVEGDVGNGFCRRVNRLKGVSLGAKQAAFFTCPEAEDQASLRRAFTLEGAGDLQQAGNAQSVVVGAGADRSSLCIRRS